MGSFEQNSKLRSHRMHISIISINYAPERTGIGVYTTGLAECLAAWGYSVTVHAAFPYYPNWEKLPGDRGRLYRRERVNDVDLRRTYVFVPARPTALKRILHELTFACTAAIAYACAARADRTIVVLPPLALGVMIGLIARLKGSRVIVHVQDLQPDAALELGMLKAGLLTRALYGVESAAYRLAHRVSTISEGMRRKIISKGVSPDKTILFRNWANDDTVRPGARDTALRAEWGLGTDDFVVLYSGNLGRKQGLSSLLDAAEELRDCRRLKMIIVGNGVEQAELIAEAAGRGLDSVLFRPLQPLDRLSELLATADVSVIPQRRAVTDIVLPSKLCNILASARPVIAAAPPGSDLAMILREGSCGVLVEPEDGAQIAAAVRALMEDPGRCSELGANGRLFAERHLMQKSIIRRFETEMSEL